ncbi:rRNA maturation RNase YbeY [Desulfosoma caldarium]|uniref:Endoribonuclease YbeY n=1 Tax=Desulfosoma caldarium TaxID=610254 RepID=A0A3N1VLY1_9BACT|nr:rRNA maturation RNase YbeY [Desulfosoma caldarium]ROR03059.1 putative rRNA maturation factor [Desulfosoma caldarium]
MAERILNALDCSDGELSLVVTDDEEMADLNQRFRGVGEPTDVLSFPMREGEFGDIAPHMLGDVVISMDTAQVMAQTARCTLDEVLDLLLIHGILHLLGHDHGEPEEARTMEALTLQLLKTLGHEPARFSWYRTDFGNETKEA